MLNGQMDVGPWGFGAPPNGYAGGVLPLPSPRINLCERRYFLPWPGFRGVSDSARVQAGSCIIVRRRATPTGMRLSEFFASCAFLAWNLKNVTVVRG